MFIYFYHITKKNINKALFYFFAVIVLKFLLRSSGRQEKENIHTFENANVEMNNIIWTCVWMSVL